MKKIISTVLVGLTGLFGGCSEAVEKNATVKAEDRAVVVKLSATEGKEMLAKDKDIILVDVRTVEEFKEGHIPNAKNIVLDTIKDEASVGLPKDAKIIVYCRSGVRSKDASKRLVALGYKHVYDMGGIINWPYEVVK